MSRNDKSSPVDEELKAGICIFYKIFSIHNWQHIRILIWKNPLIFLVHIGQLCKFHVLRTSMVKSPSAAKFTIFQKIFSQQIKISEMNSTLLRDNLNFSQNLGVQFADYIVFKIACLQLSHFVVAWVCGKRDVEVWNLTSWPNMGWMFQTGVEVEIFIQFSCLFTTWNWGSFL